MQQTAEPSGMAWLPFLTGLSLMLLITAAPRLLTDADGKADHLAATLACWSMAAGLVRGVGYVPQHRIPRWLLSASACFIALAACALRLWWVRAM